MNTSNLLKLPLWKKTIIITGLSIVLLVLFNSFIMPWYVRHDTLVTVPTVVGMQYENAVKLLDDANLEGKQGDIRYDPSKPIGMIIEQIPPEGQTVKVGRRIYLIISGGEQLYDVPNLVGRSVREARFNLTQRNLELLEESTQPSAQYPPDIIIEQVEQPGTKLKKGSKVRVVVSVGLEQGNIKVPDLAGKTIEEVKKILLQSKLTLGKITNQPSTTVPLNAVIDQYPRPNSMVKENDKIDIFVNREVKKKVTPSIQEEIFEGNVESESNKNFDLDDIPKDIEKEIEKENKPDPKIKPEIRKEDGKPKSQDKKKPKEPNNNDGTNF
jgi:serine/threonine-protein kinase